MLSWKNHGIDKEGKEATLYGVSSIPSAFLVDGTGKIVAQGNELRGINLHIAIDKLYTTIILLLSILPSVGTAHIFGPSNYEDCIIEGMQGVASDVAAVAVRSACR